MEKKNDIEKPRSLEAFLADIGVSENVEPASLADGVALREIDSLVDRLKKQAVERHADPLHIVAQLHAIEQKRNLVGIGCWDEWKRIEPEHRGLMSGEELYQLLFNQKCGIDIRFTPELCARIECRPIHNSISLVLKTGAELGQKVNESEVAIFNRASQLGLHLLTHQEVLLVRDAYAQHEQPFKSWVLVASQPFIDITGGQYLFDFGNDYRYSHGVIVFPPSVNEGRIIALSPYGMETGWAPEISWIFKSSRYALKTEDAGSSSVM